MNLVICLLVTRGYVSKDRDPQGGRRATASRRRDAFEKMFERDKDELREIGIPIEVGSHEALFDDEPGYRIRAAAFELPEITLEADEAAVVGLAARVWQHAGLAAADHRRPGQAARRRGGRRPRRAGAGRAASWPPRSRRSSRCGTPWSTRTPVRFGYRRPGREAAVRTLEPWGVLSWRGRWYVVGRDRDREAPRMFRLSRVEGAVTPAGRPGSYGVPEGTDLRALAAACNPPSRRRHRGAAGARRQRLRPAAPGACGRGRARGVGPRGGPVGAVGGAGRGGRGYGADVVALEPPELSWRQSVTAQRLRGLAEVGRRERPARATRSRGCSRWCRTCRSQGAFRSSRSPRDFGVRPSRPS